MPTRELQFFVAESPVPQPRQRFGVGFDKRSGKPVPVPMRDGTSPVHGFKNGVAAKALLSRSPQWPAFEPGWGFRLLCLFTMDPPQSLPKTRTGYTVCPVKPDLDNMVKAVAT